MDQPVLDAACGSRMFWFDRDDSRCVFMDSRAETHQLKDKSMAAGVRNLVICPDVVGDFRDMPFASGQFKLVVFDPPHLKSAGPKSWLALKYGKLSDTWQEDISRGFVECFRVLAPGGTLIFKWNEDQIKVSEVLALTGEKPLFGNRCGKRSKSHWIVFIK